jgi:hypothetical protein
VPRPALRYLIGTARRRAETAVRNLAGRVRRNPAPSRVVPAPARPKGRPILQLTHALVATDLNPLYLDFWPLARRAWPGVAGLEPLLVLVADPAQVPRELLADPAVHVFEPLPGIHTAFQAQCIRLLYPALLDVGGGVVTADVDMVPLNRRYLHRPASRIDADHFVAYRDVLLHERQVPICYNAARPPTWSALFGVESADDVRTRLAEWAAGVEYSGTRGGSGWSTDQEILYRALLEHGRLSRTVWILDDHYTGFRRLERGPLQKARRLDDPDRRLIRRGAYSDYHCLVPHADFAELNELVVDLAAEASASGADPGE